MSEIEKMYDNAGIKPKEYCDRDSDACMPCCPNWNKRQTCWKYKAIIPSFTIEKQIELIKLLGNVRDYIVEIDKFKDVYYVGCCEAGSNNKHWGSHNIFEEALAELINNLWQDLTEEERTQIKEILE